MTPYEKANKIREWCDRQIDCSMCPLSENGNYCYETMSTNRSEDAVCEDYEKVFGKGKAPVSDPVSHPAYYTQGKIEVADFIADQKLNFNRGCAIKYVCRAGVKDPACEVQDLEKAIWYINHEIKSLKEVKG